jgi:nucleotide-binding universal stress UspA family protein
MSALIQPDPTMVDEAYTAPVIVAVDETDSARAAVTWGARVASEWGRSLHLLHVSERAEDGNWPMVMAQLRDIAAAATGGRITSETTNGELAERLRERSQGALLLVMGSYGEGRSAGMLSGCNALAMVAEAACPLVLVRDAAERDGPVVVGLDGSESADRALPVAAELALVTPARALLVVHAWSDVAIDADGHPRRLSLAVEEITEQAQALLADRVGELTRHYPRLSVASRLVADTPVRALLEAARDAASVVVGHRRRTPGSSIRAGSTSRGVLEFAGCPVVVVPPTLDLRRVDDSMAPRMFRTTADSVATDAAVAIARHDITASPEGAAPVGLFTEQDATRVHSAAEQRNVAVGSIMRPCRLLTTPAPDLVGARRPVGQNTVPVLSDGWGLDVLSGRDLTGPGGPSVTTD